jgi:hypothetical protein
MKSYLAPPSHSYGGPPTFAALGVRRRHRSDVRGAFLDRRPETSGKTREELTMTAILFVERAPCTATVGPEKLSPSGGVAATASQRTGASGPSSLSCALDLSRSRTHEAVLDILKAYKLSGNFHANLEAVLKDFGATDKVTYDVEPGAMLAFPDCRHVVFMPSENVPDDVFRDIIRSIEARIGFDAPWWARLFCRFNDALTRH